MITYLLTATCKQTDNIVINKTYTSRDTLKSAVVELYNRLTPREKLLTEEDMQQLLEMIEPRVWASIDGKRATNEKVEVPFGFESNTHEYEVLIQLHDASDVLKDVTFQYKIVDANDTSKVLGHYMTTNADDLYSILLDKLLELPNAAQHQHKRDFMGMYSKINVSEYTDKIHNLRDGLDPYEIRSINFSFVAAEQLHTIDILVAAQ